MERKAETGFDKYGKLEEETALPVHCIMPLLFIFSHNLQNLSTPNGG